MTEHKVQDVAIAGITRVPQVRSSRSPEDRLALLQSVKHSGILVPLLGHRENGRIVIDDGYGRLDVAEELGFPSVPMIVTDQVPTRAERITLQFVVNTQRSDLTVMEKSRALAQLMEETGWSAAEVSLKLGKPSPATISKLLALQVLPADVQELIDDGRLAMSSAYAIATVADAAERERLIAEVVNGHLTRDRLVAQAKSVKAGRSAARPRKPREARRERVVIPVGNAGSVALSGPQLTVESVVAWLVELADRLRPFGADGRPLGDIVKALSVRRK